MAKYKAGFNQKGRSSGIAKANALKAQRRPRSERDKDHASTEEAVQVDDNDPIHVKREELRKGLSYSEPMNPKKRKRLDKYIEKKLKKDEGVHYMRKLAELQKADVHYASSKDLRRNTKNQMTGDAPRTRHESEPEDDIPSESQGSPSSDSELPDDPLVPGSPQQAPTEKEQGSLFGFQNATVRKTKHKPRVAYNWRAKLEASRRPGNSSSDENGESSTDDASSSADARAADDKQEAQKRAVSFREWATEDQNSVNPEDTPIVNISESAIEQHRARVSGRDKSPEPEEHEVLDRKAFYVTPNRPKAIEESRRQLPICAEEQTIMETIFRETCVVLCGETGSGKTTQVPQFLLEAGFAHPRSDNPGMIAVTQPRRVAAVGMANRVATELGPEFGKKVSYQIRFDSTTKPETAIKFMTDGILLKEISNDFLLLRYSVVVIDEAHERSINTDILIGLLSRIVPLRAKKSESDPTIKPLKLIIMSATLRVADFTENRRLFPSPPPILKVDARQFPVTIHFNRTTSLDYIDECFRKIVKIHNRLPPGGILVFVTGQNEILHLCERLRKEFPERGKQQPSLIRRVKPDTERVPMESEDLDGLDTTYDRRASRDGEIPDDDYDSGSSDSGLSESGFSETELSQEKRRSSRTRPLHVLPLYSLLTTQDQMRVFESPPEGHRLCVVATNVAETSLTIPGIRYVVDSGRVKECKYDEKTGVQSYEVDWISKASANQRAGRAGRTAPGHCYRLYSSAVYERDFVQFTCPEILRMPIEGIVLQMKSMAIEQVVNFPFPTSPDRAGLHKAERVLQCLGAIDRNGHITPMGERMSLFPLSPRYAKMICIGDQYGCMPYVLAIVAALSVGQLFVQSHELDHQLFKQNSNAELDSLTNEEEKRSSKLKIQRQNYYRAHQKFSMLDAEADVLKLLCAVCAYEYEGASETFCRDNFIRFKSMKEVQNLRRQLHSIVNTSSNDGIKAYRDKLMPPDKAQINALKQIVAAGFLDQVARYTGKDKEYTPLLPVETETVYVHPRSMLESSPEYVVYQNINRSSTDRITINPLTALSASELASLAIKTPLMSFSKPLDRPHPPQVVEGSGGTKRVCWVVPRLGSGLGWDLPLRKITQVRIASRWEFLQ